jgi:hypothetical protein
MPAINNVGDEWQAGAVALPSRPRLTDEQKDEVCRSLRSVGIVDDPFTMDPIKRLSWLSGSKFVAQAVYAAIKHATAGSLTLTDSFTVWSRELGLPW